MPRLRFFHALIMDIGARPNEVLALKIGDIKFELDANRRMYVPLPKIGLYGKKKKGRPLSMRGSIKYYRSYLEQDHPYPDNNDAVVFISKENSAQGRIDIAISPEQVRKDYKAFRDKIIPKLLKRPDIPQRDKDRLAALKEKLWFPYLMRHTSATRDGRNPKFNDELFRAKSVWW